MFYIPTRKRVNIILHLPHHELFLGENIMTFENVCKKKVALDEYMWVVPDILLNKVTTGVNGGSEARVLL